MPVVHSMTLRRRVLRLETRAPDQLRARIATMTDVELEARLAELEGVSVAELRRQLATEDTDKRIAELQAEIEGLA